MCKASKGKYCYKHKKQILYSLSTKIILNPIHKHNHNKITCLQYKTLNLVGKDCELRVTQNGKNTASFSIAVTQGYGEHEKTSRFTYRIFGKITEGL